MKILALDSSAVAATVALCEDERLLAEYTLNNGNTHSETLLPMIENILAQFNMTACDVELFAASSGPGSFTGVRIGAATLKGLAFGKDKPCIEVSTLEALARNLVMHKGLICPVMNARRSQVYTALFRSDGQRLTRILPDSAMAISELDEKLSEYGEPVAFCGDGYGITVNALNKTQYVAVPDRLCHQSAYSVAVAAYEKYTRGEAVTDSSFKVTYLRPSQAERELMEKNNKEKEETK